MVNGGASQNTTTVRLESKIRSQAAELVDVHEALQKQKEYSKLVEARLRDIAPGHPLPVVPSHLGQDASVLTAANRPTSSQGVAQQRQVNRLAAEVTAVKAAHEGAEARHTDAVKQVKQLRNTLQAHERETRVAQQRIATLTKELEVERRRQGDSQTTAAESIKLRQQVAHLQDELAKAKENERSYQDRALTLQHCLEARLKGGGGMDSDTHILQQKLSESKAVASKACEEADSRRRIQARLELELAQIKSNLRDTTQALEKTESKSLEMRQELHRLQRMEASRKGGGLAEAEQEKSVLLDYVQELLEKNQILQNTTEMLRRTKETLAQTGSMLDEKSAECIRLAEAEAAVIGNINEYKRLVEQQKAALSQQASEMEEMGLIHADLLTQTSEIQAAKQAAERDKNVCERRLQDLASTMEAERQKARALSQELAMKTVELDAAKEEVLCLQQTRSDLSAESAKLFEAVTALASVEGQLSAERSQGVTHAETMKTIVAANHQLKTAQQELAATAVLLGSPLVTNVPEAVKRVLAEKNTAVGRYTELEQVCSSLRETIARLENDSQFSTMAVELRDAERVSQGQSSLITSLEAKVEDLQHQLRRAENKISAYASEASSVEESLMAALIVVQRTGACRSDLKPVIAQVISQRSESVALSHLAVACAVCLKCLSKQVVMLSLTLNGVNDSSGSRTPAKLNRQSNGVMRSGSSEELLSGDDAAEHRSYRNRQKRQQDDVLGDIRRLDAIRKSRPSTAHMNGGDTATSPRSPKSIFSPRKHQRSPQRSRSAGSPLSTGGTANLRQRLHTAQATLAKLSSA